MNILSAMGGLLIAGLLVCYCARLRKNLPQTVAFAVLAALGVAAAAFMLEDTELGAVVVLLGAPAGFFLGALVGWVLPPLCKTSGAGRRDPGDSSGG